MDTHPLTVVLCTAALACALAGASVVAVVPILAVAFVLELFVVAGRAGLFDSEDDLGPG